MALQQAHTQVTASPIAVCHVALKRQVDNQFVPAELLQSPNNQQDSLFQVLAPQVSSREDQPVLVMFQEG